MKDIERILFENAYPGRGIVLGRRGENAVIAYFIMGRSANSRNRVFREEGDALTIYPFDASKVEDPSLIIYSPVRVRENVTIVTNGDQTDTIYDALSLGGSFESALFTREFEPDEPNFTPRISGAVTLCKGGFTYELSILKSADEKGSACSRYFFNYPALDGVGHFISTYQGNGSPLPSFAGEPVKVAVDKDIDAFANGLWNSLNAENKISLYVRYINMSTGKTENRLFNKYE